MGAEAYEKSGEYIPKELIESIERTRVGLKGPVTTPVGGGFSSINVALRKKFDLYANFRPIRNLPHIPTRYPDVDLIIVRENTESLYSGLEHEVVPGVVESLKIITEKASTRIANFAFDYARNNQRKKIHAIHKANIMKFSDGLFLRCCRTVAKEYPEITYGEHIVDNTCMQLVMNPYQYDMLVMENLVRRHYFRFMRGFVGGLGFVPSANLGEHCAIFEAVHGSAPDIAGKNLANPTALLRSALLMLRHLGEHELPCRSAMLSSDVYRHPEKLTRDIGGKAGTSQFADAVIEEMYKARSSPPYNEDRCLSLSVAHPQYPIILFIQRKSLIPSPPLTLTADRVHSPVLGILGNDAHNTACGGGSLSARRTRHAGSDRTLPCITFSAIRTLSTSLLPASDGNLWLSLFPPLARAKCNITMPTIGGGSPIRRHTERQARALEVELRNQGLDAHCFVAMRYWHPFTHEAIAQIEGSPMRRSCSAYRSIRSILPQLLESSLNEWRRLF